ncbi:MAG: hypothetical protein KatS3mg101_0884 [Patescibacteria group bacterium]|nr:MAG: hypothetical protein KatS3mg101_0884 [Patescibacteria group bacterium]
MSAMFKFSEFNGDISKWDVSKVKYMCSMFFGSKFNGDISEWSLRSIKNLNGMFTNSDFEGDLSHWPEWLVESRPTKVYKSACEYFSYFFVNSSLGNSSTLKCVFIIIPLSRCITTLST